jgi:hypothetical protein
MFEPDTEWLPIQADPVKADATDDVASPTLSLDAEITKLLPDLLDSPPHQAKPVDDQSTGIHSLCKTLITHPPPMVLPTPDATQALPIHPSPPALTMRCSKCLTTIPLTSNKPAVHARAQS